jgi:hypothetical protein
VWRVCRDDGRILARSAGRNTALPVALLALLFMEFFATHVRPHFSKTH